ncbi:pyruvate dehydrogenase complex transcriptional repressor PdhR [Gallaecimonas mangrovi]|uniref:pyruvate dehydrogenase complex transcriptional repressor PdhR n=1 Tax=Gallaecimonas mangrovi TaxID=2291597 RepID=UPI000E205B82|nr:pyruvate dehydrogenase complex transcriptional repressor PdhR [Gallaecimonas mangrovi]
MAGYQRIKQPRIADVIQEQLETLILEGTLAPGQKLPPERELAVQFDVSRPSVREAIQKLETKGMLVRRQGGGTYVSQDIYGEMANPLFDMLTEHPEGQLDLLEFRYALEAMAAYYAALRGTDTDFAEIRAAYVDVESAHSTDDVPLEAKAITRFHELVAQASHNVVILHLFRIMKPMLILNVQQNLEMLYQRSSAPERVGQHRKHLLECIVSGKPQEARVACEQHLAYLEETLLDIRREQSRLQRSLRRLQSKPSRSKT